MVITLRMRKTLSPGQVSGISWTAVSALLGLNSLYKGRISIMKDVESWSFER